MKKTPHKPANFRLPVDLANELREVSDEMETTQTDIVTEAVASRLKTLRGRLERKRQKKSPIA